MRCVSHFWAPSSFANFFSRNLETFVTLLLALSCYIAAFSSGVPHKDTKCHIQNHFQFKFHCRSHLAEQAQMNTNLLLAVNANLSEKASTDGNNFSVKSEENWSSFPYSAENAVTVTFLLLTFLICLASSILCFGCSLLLAWKCATKWRRRRTAQFTEDSFVIVQCLLVTLHCLTFMLNLLWKQWPRKDTIGLPFPVLLYDLNVEAGLSAIFLLPAAFPVSASMPSRCRPLLVLFTENSVIGGFAIWFPWFLLGGLLILPDLGDWTLLYLSPLLFLMFLQFGLLIGYVMRCPSTCMERWIRTMAPYQGPLQTGPWHHRRWLMCTTHYLWTVIAFLPVIILLLTIPSQSQPALAILVKMLPTVVYCMGCVALTSALVLTRFVHHCPHCLKDRDFFCWCHDHSGWVYKRVFLWQMRLLRVLERDRPVDNTFVMTIRMGGV